MRRARRPLPPALWHLKFNPGSGYYEIQEEGVTYKMQLEETRSLKDYFKDFRTASGTIYPTVEGWYVDLPKEAKKRVFRDGKLKPTEHNGFFPDTVED